ncbi:uncharacterized protein Tco025E_01686 [Trypanosoma conorhini]|uniref:WW domain-containing protein n=1 Tax=Trypanosoma conorhini TaxID=83891 RepID=A0A422Q802_9TRYP|nr:uncharacterized protein Tco025E_01686 [Trypanosoma conorhini]RNF26057.1 hypothetical protein Tco025E_01686 [Trypanosoma conorhini]
MLEEAVLAGKAVQLWELPACLHANEPLLRGFFARHFNRTAAARIKTVVFSNNSRNAAEGRSGDPPPVGSEATVEFFEPEGVELVLSRIIQHELLEQDKPHHLELRRGFIYLGQDRMLVEGVVHLLRSSSAGAKDLREGNCSAVTREGAKRPGAKGASHVAAAAARTHATVDDADDKCKGDATFFGDSGVANGLDEEEEEENVEAETDDEDHDNDNDDDDDCSDEDGGEGAEDARQRVGRSGGPQQQMRPVGGVDAVVLCMTFVCVFDLHQQGGGVSRPHKVDEAGVGITPHIVFQLLRGTCFVRKIVIFNREASLESGGAAKRRVVRALVEVGAEEDAQRVEEEFHGKILELTRPGPRGHEVEYRHRIYARYKDDPHTHRQLAVPLNTQTALSVTPRNIAMMGPVFQRQRCDRETSERSEVVREALDEYGAAAHSRQQEQQQHQHQHFHHRGDDVMVRGSDNNGGGQVRNKRRRERSSGERCRHRSRRRLHDREDSEKRRRSSRERHSHRQQGAHEDEERRGERKGVPAVADNAMQHSASTASSTFEHHHQLWQQWQLQKQQELELQKKAQQYGSLHLSPHEGLGAAVTQTPGVQYPLPPGWRAIYSDEHRRYYYVHRDPVTGAELSAWTITHIP